MSVLKSNAYLCKIFGNKFTLPRLLFRGRRQIKQSRTFATWQSSTHTAKHITALRRKRDAMNGEQQVSPSPAEESQARKKPQFGTRFLTDPKNVFQHNAWDNVVWDEEQEAEARKTTLEQLQHSLSKEKQEEYERDADTYWDKFYNQHQNRFFKDRHWLFTEFPELYSSKGNTNPDTAVIPPTSQNTNPNGNVIFHTPQDTDPNTAVIPHTSPNSESAPEESQQHDLCGPSPPEKLLSNSASDCHLDDGAYAPPDTMQNDEANKAASEVCDDGAGERSGVGERIDAGGACAGDSHPGQSATFRVLEVGCGVGNTVFPVLSTNNDPGLMMYCCDFSTTAVQLVKEHRDYDPKRCHAFVWDITDEDAKLPFPPESLDIVIMIFVLSAVHPEKMQQAVGRLARCLKPGGQLLLRDYGRYDMAQLRFKKGRCLSENFYVRGDGTRVYFFTQDELRTMLQQAGLEEVQNLIDRRLQVNRGRQLKMYRVWIQCKYRKPSNTPVSGEQKAAAEDVQGVDPVQVQEA